MDEEFVILVIAAFILVAAAMGAMAIGVIFRRPCLRGSCGGVGACACEDAKTPVPATSPGTSSTRA